VNAIVGVFVLATLALALLAVAAAARTHHWLEGSEDLGVRFPPEAVEWLSVGTPVTVAQERVGEVAELTLTRDATLLRVKVLRSARAQLREDCRAILHVPLGGVLGQPGVELRRGFLPGSFPAGREVQGSGGDELTNEIGRLAQHVDELVVRAGPALDHASGILAQLEAGGAGKEGAALLHEATALARSARERRLVTEASAAVSEVHAALAALRSGQGTAGKLLTDATLHTRLVAALERADTALDGVARLNASADTVLEDLGVLTARARTKADDLELLLARTEALVLRTNQTLDTLQRHWLVGGAIAPEDEVPPPPAVLDRPAEVTP
jgi:ABC-type transporter Mla subunit MlaD